MTRPLVVRLDEKEFAALDRAAKKRSQTRSAYVRQLIRRDVTSPKQNQGTGWAEHFERLFREGRAIDGDPVAELRKIDRSRW